MDSKSQLTSDNNYTPSARAKKAVSIANERSEAIMDGKATDTEEVSRESGDSPRNNVGGSAPKESAQYGSDTLDNPKSVNDRRA